MTFLYAHARAGGREAWAYNLMYGNMSYSMFKLYFDRLTVHSRIMHPLIPLLLSLAGVSALPEVQRRHEDLSIDPAVVAQVEKEFGALPWLTEREH